MQMVYIPPISRLNDVRHRDYQLMLPQLTSDDRYKKFFLGIIDSYTDVILDNGANEGHSISMEELAAMADLYLPSELVLPDIMGDFQGTLDKAKEYVHHFLMQTPAQTKLGFVLHGYNADDTINNYYNLRKIREVYSLIDVLYIPRRLVTRKDPRARITVAKVIASEELKKSIHFLGASPLWLSEIKETPRYVRSMDTSAPYVYALRHKSVEDDVQVYRDEETYFYETLGLGTRRVAAQNIEIMDKWCDFK
jgi:hypothetical protein